MHNGQPTHGTLPPEIPPFRPPTPPTEPPAPGPHAPQPPAPILPSWEEPDPRVQPQDVTDRLLERRILVVGGALDNVLAERITAQLLLLGRSRRPIELHLSCPESELGASLALADAIDLMAAPVHAIVRGILRGPAIAVLCAAERRTAHQHALFVLEVPSAAQQAAGRLENLAEQHRRQVTQLRARLAAATRREESEIAADLESGRLLSAEEALAYGLVHELR